MVGIDMVNLAKRTDFKEPPVKRQELLFFQFQARGLSGSRVELKHVDPLRADLL